MLTQPLSGTDVSVISVSSPAAFPLAAVGEDVSKRQTGVFSPLSTPHPCAFSPSALTPPPNSHTPVPPSIHLNPPPPPSSLSLSTALFVSPQSASTLPPSSSTLPFSVSSTFSLPPCSATASPAAPHSPVICSSSSSPSVSAALHHLLPPPPPPSCCPCSSILPRLLSAHRMEVRRLLRGALSSLGRRLDSLERKSKRKKRRRMRQTSEAAFPCSCSPAPIPPLDSSLSSPSSFSTSLSSHREDSCKSKQSKNKQGEEKVTLRKKSRNSCGVEGEEEEDTGRFVGQMAVSFTRRRGDTEGTSLLTLHNFSHREEQGESSQSDKAVSVLKQNGYRSASHHPLPCLQSVHSDWSSIQSEAACVSSVQWDFSSSSPFTSLRSSHTFSHRQLCGSSVSPTPMLLLSSVAMETVSKLLRVGACGSPLWPLKDWTAPPSLMSDHCYVRLLTPSLTLSTVKGQKKQLANHMDQSLPVPQGWPPPLPPCSANGLFAPLPASQSAADSSFLSTNAKRSKRVSQIRIRRATPRETQLTPMGLPKIRRLKKKEFSLEEIYTNKNYKSPTTNRSLETIFEEPREKDGALLLIGQQKRRRLLLFPDFTQPRKRKKPQGFPVAVVPRKRAARRHCHGDRSCDDSVDLDVMLVERLSELEDFLTQQGLDV